MRLLTHCLVIVLLLGLVPISLAQGDDITVTQDQNDDTITLHVGDVLRVALDSNPTTGYDWLATTDLWTATATADVSIVEVMPDTPAAEAKLRAGDIIQALNGQPIQSAEDFSEQLAAVDTTDVTLAIMRETQQGSFSLPLPDATPELDRIYVNEIAQGTPAATAGFEVGDVLLSVDDTDLTSVDQLVDYVQAHENTELQVSVLRDGETFVIPVTPQADEEGNVRMGLRVEAAPVTPLGLVALNRNINQHVGLRDASTENSGILLDLMGEPEFIGPDDPAPGEGGTAVWSFQAMVPGTTELTLHYLPISEENPEPTETFHLTIVIEPGSGILESERETVTLSDMDNGKPVALHIGDTLRIELEANATTGYEWSLGLVDPSVLQQRGEPEYIGPEQALPGAGGTSVWTFEAVRAGTTQLALHYARPFETDVEPIQVFEITVGVE